MKPTENIEDFVRRRKAKVAAGPEMDRRVLDDSFAAMDDAKGGFSAARMMLRGRLVKLAAAVVILAIGLLAIQLAPSEQEQPAKRSVAKSPADMLSVISLNMAFRRGGIEEVDNVSGKAFEMLGSKPVKVSLRELLTESNGA